MMNNNDNDYSPDWMKDDDDQDITVAPTNSTIGSPSRVNNNNNNDRNNDNEQPSLWAAKTGLEEDNNDQDEEKGLQAQAQAQAQQQEQAQIYTTRDENDSTSRGGCFRSRIEKIWKYDKALLACILVMVIVLNIPGLKFVLYPFMVFSTWIHELCHGMAALFVGGRVTSIHVYPDGSGRAYWYYVGEIPDGRCGFVSSAGYTGTAVVGCLLLLVRRKKLVPPVGCIVIGCSLLLSIFCWIRNAFGISVLLLFAVLLIVLGAVELKFHDRIEIRGKKVPLKTILRFLYSLLAATCSFNAVDSITDLYSVGNLYVDGEPMSSDAVSVAGCWGATSGFWATWWLMIAIVMSFVGLVFALDKSPSAKQDTTAITT